MSDYMMLSPLGVQINVVLTSPDHMLCSEFWAFDLQSRMLPVFAFASDGLQAEAWCRLERWNEFDKLVSMSDVARGHILSLPAHTPLGDVAHAQHRVRTVVAADAARRALAEIQGGNA